MNTKLSVRDIMTTNVVTIPAASDLRQAVEILSRNQISGAPVVDHGHVVGVLSATDLLQFMRLLPLATRRVPTATVIWEAGQGGPGAFYVEGWTGDGAEAGVRLSQLGVSEPDWLQRHTVAEVMSGSLCAVRPDATLSSAADYLLRAGVHRVLVLEARKLVGILTTTDFVRAIAQSRLGEAAIAPGHTVTTGA